MRRFVVTIAAATIFLAGAPIMGANVGAAPIVAPGAIRAAADSLNVVESVQFIWLGHDYCWYDDGWNGPGWYWCDYGYRIGLGWGGGYGWHHWRGGHPGGGKGDHISKGGSQGGKAVSQSSKAISQGSTGGSAQIHSGGGGPQIHSGGGGPQIHSGGGGGGGGGKDKQH
jgi:hypothetical protein